MNFYRRIFFLMFFVFPLFSNADSANISSLIFVNEELRVEPGVTSEGITIETQNASGEAEKTSETFDLVITSDSPTGEFLISSGKPISPSYDYISKGNARRTFYYKDSSSGVFTINITATGRDSGKSVSASQKIYVGVVDSNIESVSKNTEEVEEKTSSVSNSSSSSSSYSSHSSPIPLSNILKDIDFRADAGRDRVVPVNSFVDFNAKIADLGTNSGRPNFEWNFGDGFHAQGKDVKHVYLFPGEYNVVLNVSVGGMSAVSRSKIKVIIPQVELVSVNKEKGFVSVKNNSNSEINLGGFGFRSGFNITFLPKDTILSSGSILNFPIQFGAEDVDFIYPNKVILNSKKGVANTDLKIIQSLQEDLNKAKIALFNLKQIQNTYQDNSVVIAPKVAEVQSENDLLVYGTTTISKKEELINSLKESSEESVWYKIISSPVSGFRYIKNLFSK